MASYFQQHGDITAAEWIRNVTFRLGSAAESAGAELYQIVPDIQRPGHLSLTPESQAEVDRQVAEVKKSFTGSMKEILTKIPFFKNWFGDWERSAAGSTLEDSAHSLSILHTDSKGGFSRI